MTQTISNGESNALIRAKLNEVITKVNTIQNIKDFGAVGDGVTNDTAAFLSFVNSLSQYGAEGYIPAGTYLIDGLTKTFTGLPFTITGAGKDKTILKNRTPTSNFLYWTNVTGLTIQELTLDGDYTGTQTGLTSGAHLGLVNSSDVTIRNVVMRNFRRCGILSFNDHQTTITNVYENLVFDGVEIYGPSNYSNNIGPSAFIIADVNNSVMRNCYIENIGLYGYEFKNDCYNTLITNCIAVNTYNGIYYGGDGARVDLLYVKNSMVDSCILVDCFNPIFIGTTKGNVFQNCEIRTTDLGPTPTRAHISLETTTDTVMRNMHIIGRKDYAVDMRATSTGNYVEFSLADTSFTGEAVNIAADSTGNQAVIAWKNHDTSVLNKNRFTTQNNVWDTRAKYRYQYGSETNPRIEDALSWTRPSYLSTVKGRVQFGDTFDVHTNTNQNSLYENFGNFTTAILSQVRHRFDTGEKIETIWASGGASNVSFIKSQAAFTPGTDNALKLGNTALRWSTVYAATGTIDTSDARDKQDIELLSEAEKTVALELKGLVRKYRFKDAVALKGDGARIHVGVIAQDVIEAFRKEGLDPMKYGIVCYDEWEETETHPAGSRYGIRYDELLAFIVAVL